MRSYQSYLHQLDAEFYPGNDDRVKYREKLPKRISESLTYTRASYIWTPKQPLCYRNLQNVALELVVKTEQSSPPKDGQSTSFLRRPHILKPPYIYLASD
jgi:hypothetical protein